MARLCGKRDFTFNLGGNIVEFVKMVVGLVVSC